MQQQITNDIWKAAKLAASKDKTLKDIVWAQINDMTAAHLQQAGKADIRSFLAMPVIRS